MLKLKRVEIQGFKSFYERTEMKFSGQGIAAVVGPNGCGKSNLSDAISWVLGEQSAKSLRGARMEDVIFAGTRDRKALGMASVTMTLVPGEARLKPEASGLPPAPVHVSGENVGRDHVGGDSPASWNAPAEDAAPGHPAPPDLSSRESASDVASSGGESSPPGSAAPILEAISVRGGGEITITRRLYRSGDSEYLINGKIARLRDIQDLFLGTGLGPESYAIIEQGRIGQILSHKPQDRRNVIEEAAGVTKFKTRKRLAEARLESAKGNLARVFDILEEVTRQVNTLKRQAAKTRRYDELRQESLACLRLLLAGRFEALDRQMAQRVIERTQVASEWDQIATEMTVREEAQANAQAEHRQLDQGLQNARQTLAGLQVDSERLRVQIDSQGQQIGSAGERLVAAHLESEALAKQLAGSAVEREAQAAELAALERESGQSRERLQHSDQERQRAQEELKQHEDHLEGLRQGVLRILNELSTWKHRLAQEEARAANADQDRKRTKAEESQAVSDLTRVERTRSEISARLEARQIELVSLTDQRTELEEELKRLRTSLEEARQNADRLRTEHSRTKARHDSIADIIAHRSYTTEAVKRLFTAVEKSRADDLKPVGMLADFLEITDGELEKAAEEFLHDELEYVVVRNWREAEQGVALMRSDLEGRGTFLVEEASGEPAPPEPFLIPDPGSLAAAVRLSDCVRLTNGLSGMPLAWMYRLAHAYVASDPPTAKRLAEEFPHCWFLTRDGLQFHGKAMTGGKKSGSGPLALKREARELAAREKALGQELAAALTNAGTLDHTLRQTTEQLEGIRSKQRSEERDALALDHQSRTLAEEGSRTQARLSRARMELDRLEGERMRLEETLEADRTAFTRLDEDRQQAEWAFEAARESLQSRRGTVSRLDEVHAELRAAVASVEERVRSGRALSARLESQMAEIARRRDQLASESARVAQERELLEAELVRFQAGREHALAAASHCQSEVSRTAAAEGEARARLASSEEVLRDLRRRATETADRRSELHVAMARVESDLAHLDETSRKELSLAAADLKSGIDVERASLEDAAQLESNYNDLRRKMEALGPVNPEALAEWAEASERQEFLQSQRQDLLHSIRDTESAIAEIDGESKKRFTEAFAAINANFREMFTVLFGGGTGEMRLTDESSVSDSGIDIVASPPGKRLQSVLLLSGGEKSLTAMALLMAVFQYTPSPFCVLDEVDAPLDEPNTDRLTRLLREMADQTQFIVITHSKRTMEAAQALYGVTMQEPGVSKLVSVKFKDSSTLAASGQRDRSRTRREQAARQSA